MFRSRRPLERRRKRGRVPRLLVGGRKGRRRRLEGARRGRKGDGGRQTYDGEWECRRGRLEGWKVVVGRSSECAKEGGSVYFDSRVSCCLVRSSHFSRAASPSPYASSSPGSVHSPARAPDFASTFATTSSERMETHAVVLVRSPGCGVCWSRRRGREWEGRSRDVV